MRVVRIAPRAVATLPEAELADAAAAAVRIAGEHTAAADIVAVAHTAAAVRTVVAAAGPAAMPARAAGFRIPAEAVARRPSVIPGRFARTAEVAEEALRPPAPRPPSPGRRRKGSLSSREEHRVRIADISS